ncbi:flagellar biosynthesis protein FlhB [Candidatus Paracaedibacter symbiosus]|uniref:flagellar biosynthesis protein FlhB n=1 Tax=Candidatus Paracaedibacter symbiosus TaxID=244582 RepID=UPI0005094785|nr:flagellar biosynthesis protein FlhB [Candidatus Paracaedibacter symbiosus]
MADDKPEQDQKTEQATQHRIDEAFKKGQVAMSREVTHWFALVALALTIMIFLPFSFWLIQEYLALFIVSPHLIHLDGEVVERLMGSVFLKIIICFVPLGIILIAATLGAGFLQTRLAIQMDALMPKFERISPFSGIKRLISKKALVDFIKNLLKLSAIAACLLTFLGSKIISLPGWTDLHPHLFLRTIQGLALKCLLIIICLLTLIAVLDYLYQKYEFLKNLKMTKEEVKKEHKNTEGDPLIKQRQRQLSQQLIRRNMMKEVPNSSVIVMNPTHYAVALKYEPETMDAPVVVAKGLDLMALRIRDIGRENKVPIVQNPPLARALYKGVEVSQEIPTEHYKAVAEIINFVMNLKKQERTKG